MLLFTFNWPKHVTQPLLVKEVGDRIPSQGEKLDIHVQKYTKAAGFPIINKELISLISKKHPQIIKKMRTPSRKTGKRCRNFTERRNLKML